MAKILRTNMFHECDFESERSLLMDSSFLIFTKDSQKWWKIYNGDFIEVLKENIQGSLGRSGNVIFLNEQIKNVTFGIIYLGIPRVVLTLNSESATVPYKTLATSTGLTINFKSKYTGIVEWSTFKI